MNNKKKLCNETSESVDETSGIKTFVEIYNENKKKLQKTPAIFFCRLQNVSKSVEYKRILLIKVKESKKKKKNQKKITFFLLITLVLIQ